MTHYRIQAKYFYKMPYNTCVLNANQILSKLLKPETEKQDEIRGPERADPRSTRMYV